MAAMPRVLSTRAVAVKSRVSGWREAVRLAGNLLVRVGAVEPGYVRRMIQNIEELGPYVVLGRGVALPHARPEDGVKRVALSVVTLQRPILFPGREDSPVDVVIGLAAVDNTSHITVMQRLAEMLDNRGFADRARRARSARELLRQMAPLSTLRATGAPVAGA